MQMASRLIKIALPNKETTDQKSFANSITYLVLQMLWTYLSTKNNTKISEGI